ncbi:MAG: hypothetical protein M3153_04475 [Chloroflexota bacterium]|nr:hypothetical protein [Chloroflexota bacterium]
MFSMRRVVGLVAALALTTAACAAPGSSGSVADPATDPGMAPGHDMAGSMAPSAGEATSSPAASSGEASDDGRVSIDDVLTDPAAFEGHEVTLSENVDQVFVEDVAFLFSGIEVEGQILVVLTPGATIEKGVQADRVLSVTGSLVPFTAEDLEAAGAGLSLDDDALAEFEGDVALVATEVTDPLGG